MTHLVATAGRPGSVRSTARRRSIGAAVTAALLTSAALAGGPAEAVVPGAPSSATVAASPAAADAAQRGGCPKQISVTTTKGVPLWIPSSRTAGAFQFGGSQSISTSEGRLSSTTTGSSDTYTGSVKLGFKIVEATASYAKQYNRSTTETQSFSDTFMTNSGEVSRKINWRWRLYVRGYRYVATRTEYVPTPCTNAMRETRRMRVTVPSKSNNPAYSFQLETYQTRGRAHNDAGKPVK